MMRGYVFCAEALAQIVRDAFGQASGVDEHQCGTMLLDQGHETVINRVPHFVGCDRPQRHRRNFHREIELALVTNIYDDRRRPAASAPIVHRQMAASKKMRDLFNWLLRRRQANAHWRLVSERFEALE